MSMHRVCCCEEEPLPPCPSVAEFEATCPTSVMFELVGFNFDAVPQLQCDTPQDHLFVLNTLAPLQAGYYGEITGIVCPNAAGTGSVTYDVGAAVTCWPNPTLPFQQWPGLYRWIITVTVQQTSSIFRSQWDVSWPSQQVPLFSEEGTTTCPPIGAGDFASVLLRVATSFPAVPPLYTSVVLL